MYQQQQQQPQLVPIGNAGMQPPGVVYTSSNSPGPGWQQSPQWQPWAPFGANNGPGLGGLGGLVRSVQSDDAAESARENARLDHIMSDFSKQMVEAAQKVRKLERAGASRKQASVFPLRKLGDTALVSGGKILVSIPKGPAEALSLVERMLQLLAARLVPAMSYARQKPVSYVLAMVSTYVARVASLVSSRVNDDEPDADAADDSREAIMLTRALNKIDDAMSDIPTTREAGDSHLWERLELRSAQLSKQLALAQAPRSAA
jgi:hypothetical protein